MILTHLQENIFTITLDRPEALNALTGALARAILAAVHEAYSTGARAIVLTGNGRAFCAGADLVSASPAISNGTIAESIDCDMCEATNPLIEAISSSPIPVICAVNGACVGGGVGLALACDIVLAARKAYFLIPQVATLGIIPDLGATWKLPRSIGRARALGIQLLGERISAERAEAWGLIWQCVDDESLLGETMRIAHQLAAMPGAAIQATRRLNDTAQSSTLFQQLEEERQLQVQCARSESFAIAVSRFAAAARKSVQPQ